MPGKPHIPITVTNAPGVVNRDQVEHELGRVEVHGAWVPQAFKVRERRVFGAVVDHLPVAEEDDVCGWCWCWCCTCGGGG